MLKHTKRQVNELCFLNMRFIAMFINAVCVLFLIKLRWPKKKSIYDNLIEVKRVRVCCIKGVLLKLTYEEKTLVSSISIKPLLVKPLLSQQNRPNTVYNKFPSEDLCHAIEPVNSCVSAGRVTKHWRFRLAATEAMYKILRKYINNSEMVVKPSKLKKSRR